MLNARRSCQVNLRSTQRMTWLLFAEAAPRLRKWRWPLNHSQSSILNWGATLSNICSDNKVHDRLRCSEQIQLNPLHAFHAVQLGFLRETGCTEGWDKQTLWPPAGRFHVKESWHSSPRLKVMMFHPARGQAWAHTVYFLFTPSFSVSLCKV